MRLTLKSPGQFYDPETKIRIMYGDIVDVARVGSLTRQFMNAGGIIMVPPDTPIIPKVDIPTEVPSDISVEVPVSESRLEDLELIMEDDPIQEVIPKKTLLKKPGKRGRPKKDSKR